MGVIEAEIRRALLAGRPASALDAAVRELIADGVEQRSLADAFTAVLISTAADDPSVDILQEKMDEVWGGPWAKGRDLFPTPLPNPREESSLRRLLRGDPDGPQTLGADELELCCLEIASSLRTDAGGWSYSSHQVKTALQAVATASRSVPEPLLAAIWRLSAEDELTPERWAFMKLVGNLSLSLYRDHPGWSLHWMGAPISDAQAALSYWSLACNPGAVDEESLDRLEERIHRLERTLESRP